MTPTELSAAGNIIFGKFWQSALARALHVHGMTVRRWKSGKHQVPGPAVIAIEQMVREKLK